MIDQTLSYLWEKFLSQFMNNKYYLKDNQTETPNHISGSYVTKPVYNCLLEQARE